jgi:hypothetical protein
MVRKEATMNDVVHDDRSASPRMYPEGMAPPVESLDLAKRLLSAHHAEFSAKRYRQHVELARLQDQARKLTLAHVQTEGAEFRQLVEAQRTLAERRIKETVRIRDQGNDLAWDVQTFAQAGLTFAVPPYDFDWVAGSNPGFEHADRRTGGYDMRQQSIGNGQQNSAAGVGFWFFSGAGNPAQRFAALIDYFDAWWDQAGFYVAHNTGRTRLWVFGVAENDWVGRADQTPSWSDGVGWLESHGNAPEGEDGTVANEVYFNAAPNSWYQCWVWSSAEVFGDVGLFGLSASSIEMRIAVKLAILGSLG